MTRVIIPIANGSEEMEAVTLADLFRRAGWEVVIAGFQGNGPVTASHGVRILPDAHWETLDLLSFDLIALPGGMEGTQAFCKNDGIQEALRVFDIEELWIGAICAAPLALHTAGILKNRTFTCYPGIEKEMGRTDREEAPVVTDGHIVTSQGPGTAIAFALKLIELINGADAAKKVADGLLYRELK